MPGKTVIAIGEIAHRKRITERIIKNTALWLRWMMPKKETIYEWDYTRSARWPANRLNYRPKSKQPKPRKRKKAKRASTR